MSKEEVVELIIQTARDETKTSLDLSNLGLSELPREIGLLTHLIELDISGNWLTDLPEEIRQLKNLKRLNLSNNLFTSLPELSQLPNLESVELDANPCPLIFPQRQTLNGKMNKGGVTGRN